MDKKTIKATLAISKDDGTDISDFESNRLIDRITEVIGQHKMSVFGNWNLSNQDPTDIFMESVGIEDDS